jgi:hypothetical protein
MDLVTVDMRSLNSHEDITLVTSRTLATPLYYRPSRSWLPWLPSSISVCYHIRKSLRDAVDSIGLAGRALSQQTRPCSSVFVAGLVPTTVTQTLVNTRLPTSRVALRCFRKRKKNGKENGVNRSKVKQSHYRPG